MTRRTLTTIAGAGLVLLLLNTAYVAAFPAASILYMGNVLIHLVLGVAVVLAGGVLMLTAHDVRRRLWLPAAFLAGSAGSAAALVAVGNLLEYRWILQTHIGLSALAVQRHAAPLIAAP